MQINRDTRFFRSGPQAPAPSAPPPAAPPPAAPPPATAAKPAADGKKEDLQLAAALKHLKGLPITAAAAK